MEIIDPEFFSHLLSFGYLGSHLEGIRRTLDKLKMPHVKITDGEVVFSLEEAQVRAEWLSSNGFPRSGDILREWAEQAAGSRNLGAEIIMPEMKRSIEREMKANLFLRIPDEKRAYFSRSNLFGLNVARAFPSASGDIQDAGKCLALGRYTACVFHLMRVLEVALRTLGKTLNDPSLDPRTNPAWDRILKKMNDELRKERAQRSPEWAADDGFFSGVAAMLIGIKTAWRNPTMHVETNYNEEQALDIWNHVCSFMRHLTTRISE